MGVEFRNECVAVDLSLSRRFTSSTSVTPTTDFALSVELIGFGSGQKAGPSGQCRGRRRRQDGRQNGRQSDG